MIPVFQCKYVDIEEAFKNQQLFQDAEGKIPVTEVGQSIGLILYSDGSQFLKSPTIAESPTLMKDRAGNLCIESVDGEWI